MPNRGGKSLKDKTDEKQWRRVRVLRRQRRVASLSPDPRRRTMRSGIRRDGEGGI